MQKGFFDTDGTTASNTFEKVLDAIQSQDQTALKLLFSKKALDEAEDIDESINYLFDFFQGEIESHDWANDAGGPIADGLFEHGNKRKELKSWFDVVTDKEKYVFFFWIILLTHSNPATLGYIP